MLFLLAGSFTIVSGIIAVVSSQVRVLTEMSFAKQSYMSAEGGLEDVVYRYHTGMNVTGTETLTMGDVTVTTRTTNIPGGKQVIASGVLNERERNIEAILIEGDGAAFSFGVQTHTGGLILENSSSINGNAYSNGPIEGFNLNLIRGTAISAGPAGSVSEIHATGSIFAHNIEDSWAEDDAFYTTIDSTTVDGTLYPGSPDLATSTLPITDALLDTWETFAASSSVMTAECTAAGGTITFDTDVTLGPVKIPCNVVFNKFPTITVSGVIWITGNMTISQGPEFEVAPAIGNRSVPIVVDNPTNRLTSSKVVMNNSGAWSGNGDRSYLMVVSRNESAEQGGSEKAIVIQQSTGGALLVYAGHGEINLQNNTDLTEITAYRVRLQNSTEVIYDSGLASAVFVAGPGGSYVIDSWKEVE
jgi:hypothetical protein